jgi:hypothetical protein
MIINSLIFEFGVIFGGDDIEKVYFLCKRQ